MRSVASAATLCGLLLNVGFAQVNSKPSLQPTRLEAFASLPTAHITWSKEVGRLERPEARAIVTALVVENPHQPPYRRRGIRIELSNQKARDQVYIEDTHLEAVKQALDKIANGIGEFRNEPRSSPLMCLGACELRQPCPTVHTLDAAYYIARDSSGLSLSAFKAQEFRFPGYSPSRLATAIAKAMDEFKQR
jgi:hypothetical protein